MANVLEWGRKVGDGLRKTPVHFWNLPLIPERSHRMLNFTRPLVTFAISLFFLAASGVAVGAGKVAEPYDFILPAAPLHAPGR